MIEQVRRAGHVALRTVTVPEPSTAPRTDALRARLVGLALSTTPGEAWYLPFAHRPSEPEQVDLLGVVIPKTASKSKAAASGRAWRRE